MHNIKFEFITIFRRVEFPSVNLKLIKCLTNEHISGKFLVYSWMDVRAEEMGRGTESLITDRLTDGHRCIAASARMEKTINKRVIRKYYYSDISKCDSKLANFLWSL